MSLTFATRLPIAVLNLLLFLKWHLAWGRCTVSISAIGTSIYLGSQMCLWEHSGAASSEVSLCLLTYVRTILQTSVTCGKPSI